jgi:hypothetical protein
MFKLPSETGPCALCFVPVRFSSTLGLMGGKATIGVQSSENIMAILAGTKRD